MTIEERLDKLELKLARARFINRMLGVIGIGAFLVMWLFASGTLITQDKVMDEVRSKQFTLVDENGINRGGLAVHENGADLTLRDENGNHCAILDVWWDGHTKLTLYDKSGIPRNGLHVFKDGQPGLVLSNEKGESRVELLVGKDGAYMTLFEKNGSLKWEAP